MKTSNKHSVQNGLNRRDSGTTANNRLLVYHIGSRSDCGLVGRDAV